MSTRDTNHPASAFELLRLADLEAESGSDRDATDLDCAAAHLSVTLFECAASIVAAIDRSARKEKP